jgi:hypothetical protein
MIAFKRVLFPVDFSAESRAVAHPRGALPGDQYLNLQRLKR